MAVSDADVQTYLAFINVIAAISLSVFLVITLGWVRWWATPIARSATVVTMGLWLRCCAGLFQRVAHPLGDLLVAIAWTIIAVAVAWRCLATVHLIRSGDRAGICTPYEQLPDEHRRYL